MAVERERCGSVPATAGALLVALFFATTGAGAAELILKNGKIFTLDPLRPSVEAVAIERGIVVGTGSNAEVLSRKKKDTTVIDLGGYTAVPGLNDSHAHVVRGGRFYNSELRWDGIRSLSRALSMVEDQARRTPRGQWVRVIGGWSPFQFNERRMPTPAELTAAAPEVPVFVLFLYSQGFLNAAGVRALGITSETAPPSGGRYELTDDGGAILHAEPDPTILYKTIAKLPPLSSEEQVNSSVLFYRELSRFGLTSAVDAGGGGHLFPGDYEGSFELARRGELPLRVSNFLFPQVPGRELDSFKNWASNWVPNVDHGSGFVVEGGGEFLVWSAGDFENFLAPRPDITSREGWRDELTAVARFLVQRRWPLRIHATYNESIGHILDVFEEIHRTEVEAGRPGFLGVRWAFDHAETVSKENLKRIAALGGGIAIQARMAYAGEYFIERYGEQAAGSAPPLRDIIEFGIPLGAGTDATRVASYNPWDALYWLVSGKTVGGTAQLSDRHRLSRGEALSLYTVGSAWFSGDEARKGRIAPGQLADIAVLSADYFSVPEGEIPGIESVLTIARGQAVYGAAKFKNLAPKAPSPLPSWSPVSQFGGYGGAGADR